MRRLWHFPAQGSAVCGNLRVPCFRKSIAADPTSYGSSLSRRRILSGLMPETWGRFLRCQEQHKDHGESCRSPWGLWTFACRRDFGGSDFKDDVHTSGDRAPEESSRLVPGLSPGHPYTVWSPHWWPIFYHWEYIGGEDSLHQFRIDCDERFTDPVEKRVASLHPGGGLHVPSQVVLDNDDQVHLWCHRS